MCRETMLPEPGSRGEQTALYKNLPGDGQTLTRLDGNLRWPQVSSLTQQAVKTEAEILYIL